MPWTRNTTYGHPHRLLIQAEKLDALRLGKRLSFCADMPLRPVHSRSTVGKLGSHAPFLPAA